MVIDGLEIAGFRSFSPRGVRISGLQKINVFIGKNNCGKSNVLRFIHLLGAFTRERRHSESAPKIDPLLDFSLGANEKQISFGVQCTRSGATSKVFEEISSIFGPHWQEVFPGCEESIWFQYVLGSDIQPTTQSVKAIADFIQAKCSTQFSNQLVSQLRGYSGGSADGRARDIALAMHQKVRLHFPVHHIGAFRRITNDAEQSLAGGGLIAQLRALQSPELAHYSQGKERFSKISGFVRTILGESSATIEIPATKDEIYVTIQGKVLPIESLGTGIHELIILAAAVTLIDNSIFCIEEPEIHLHPELQKKFFQYAASSTSNQYFIASHSNAFFDLAGVNIYSCSLADGNTTCALASTAADKHSVLEDLGYKPSDLLQANFIVWVEGPSDRIYVKHWMCAKAPELIEGLHYSIMFYGGRLLSHLCFDDPLVMDFIQLSCFNRNACIVLDSDRGSRSARLNDTKRRVIHDFRGAGCVAWVTAGRSIENYIPEAILNNAIAKVHPRGGPHARKWERFADLTKLRSCRTMDKVMVARTVCSEPPEYGVLDLGKRVDDLVAVIRKKNFQ